MSFPQDSKFPYRERQFKSIPCTLNTPEEKTEQLRRLGVRVGM